MSDYEMLQPFAQIARDRFAMTPEERASTIFTRFAGPSVPFGKYLSLEKRGWQRGLPQDAGIVPDLLRRLPDGTVLHMDLEQSLWTGYITETPDQPILGVWVGDDDSPWGAKNSTRTLEDIDPIIISELIRDLTSVFGWRAIARHHHR